MADDPQTPPIDDDADELLLDQPIIDPDDEDAPTPEDGEMDVLTFGDDAEPQNDDTNLVKHLRQQLRDRDKRLAEASRAPVRSEPIVVGDKPTLSDFDFDEDKYETELDAWKERNAAEARELASAQEAGEEEKRAWAAELQRYGQGKQKLNFADVDDAEEIVKTSLDDAQRAVLVYAADDPAKLAYALGKNPTKLAELAAEKNPLKLAAKIARLEGQLKVVKRKAPAAIDEPERGSGKISTTPGGVQKQLAKLKAKAEETSDYTEYLALKRKHGA